MIKPQNRNKILRIFQIIFLVGMFLIQYYSKKKMGVQRTLVFYNYNLENNYNIKTIFILIALVFFTFIIFSYIKYKNLKEISLLCILAILILMVFDITKFKLTKYAISLLLLIINILEINKIGEKNEKIK